MNHAFNRPPKGRSNGSFARSIIAAVGLVLSACAARLPPPEDLPLRVQNQAEAGSVHVAVLASSPWDDVREKLRPDFALTAEQARQLAVPATQQYVDRAVRAMAVGLGVDLGTRSRGTAEDATTASSNGTSGSSAGDAAATAAVAQAASSSTTSSASKRTTVTNSPGAAASAPPSTLDVAARAALQGAASEPKALAIDPVLQFKVATAIFQEVKLLGEAVDKAVQRNGFTAHLVRLQVSLMPRSNRMPYDAYVNISFFSTCLDGPAGRCAEGSRGGETLAAPVVVPLLVTDNIESTLNQRSLEAIQQVALTLSGVRASIGLSAGVNSASDRQQQLLGRSLNAVMTVGRVTDNTLRVRLGAVNQGSAGLRMVPRTHDVSLLVLAPPGAQRVTVTAKTEFVDVDTAQTLPSRSQTAGEDEAHRRVAKKYNEYCLVGSDDQPNDRYKVLHQVAFLGDQAWFVRELAQMRADCIKERAATTVKPDAWPDPPSVAAASAAASSASAASEVRLASAVADHHLWRKATYVWADMVSTIPGSRFSHAVFDLAVTSQPKNLCPITQTAVLYDDEDKTTVALPFGEGLQSEKLRATLNLARPGAAHGPVQLAATETVMKAGTLVLSFPSLAELGLAGAAKQARLSVAGCEGGAPYDVQYVALKPKATADPARLSLSTTRPVSENNRK